MTTGLCAGIQDAPSRIEGKPKRGRPRTWLPLRDGYEHHIDDNRRVRDRHRHPVSDQFLIDELVGAQRHRAIATHTLFCCGRRWPADDLLGARIHQINCVEQSVCEHPHGKPGRVTRSRSTETGMFMRRIDGNARIPLASGAIWGDVIIIPDVDTSV